MVYIKVLVFGESKDALIEGLTVMNVLKEAEVYALTFTSKEQAEEVLDYIDKLYMLEEEFNPEVAFTALSNIFERERPDIVAALSTKNSNDILARLASSYNLPMSTEILALKVKNSSINVERVILGGRAISVESLNMPAVVTLAYKKFEEPKPKGSRGSMEVVKVTYTPHVKLLKREAKERSAINIEAAEIVVGVGRGFKSKDDLKMAAKLAEMLGGQVGCTRPIAADYGWLPEDLWIGITGKKIRPKLYIAIGISGAPQHISSALDSKVIVSINKDKNAPIFQYSDYGIVADLYEFLPVLIEKLKAKLKG